MRDPDFYRKQIAEYGPIFKLTSGRRPTCCIFGHERGLKLLREHDEVLLGDPLEFSRFIPQGFIRYMNPSVHKKYRKLFHKGISAETIDRSAPFIAATVRETLNRLADACRHSPTRKVDPDEYIRDMLFTIFLQLFFGVQRNAPLSDDMRSLYAIIDLRNRACGSDRKKKRATEELIVLLRQRAASYGDVRAERAARPRCFLRVVMEADPDAARDDTLLGNLVYTSGQNE
jgi:cytochrome P450